MSVVGPDSLMIGNTGVWTVSASLPDLYTDLTIDVLAPLYLPDVMTIDRISIGSVGKWIDDIHCHYLYNKQTCP